MSRRHSQHERTFVDRTRALPASINWDVRSKIDRASTGHSGWWKRRPMNSTGKRSRVRERVLYPPLINNLEESLLLAVVIAQAQTRDHTDEPQYRHGKHAHFALHQSSTCDPISGRAGKRIGRAEIRQLDFSEFERDLERVSSRVPLLRISARARSMDSRERCTHELFIGRSVNTQSVSWSFLLLLPFFFCRGRIESS